MVAERLRNIRLMTNKLNTAGYRNRNINDLKENEIKAKLKEHGELCQSLLSFELQ